MKKEQNTMTNFKEHDGMLFKMLEEPTPLTPDAKMPCLVRLIQDDSPMGKHNKDLHGFDPERLAPKICTEVVDINDLSDPNRGSARCDGFMSIQYYRYELIGTFVEEGSDKWALYQMMKGNKVRHESYSMPKVHCAMNEKHQIAIFTTPSSMIDGGDVICHANDWLTSRQVDATIDERTGWQIYKEPESDKEPIADCDNCKHRCTKSNIDYCQMYEPKPEPAKEQFEVGDWVDCKDPVGVHAQCKVLEILEHNVIVECKTGHRWSLPHNNIIRKLDHSEIVVRIGCLSGTIAKSCDPNYFLMIHSRPMTDCNHSMIRFSALDTETRELVESLLEAMRGES